MASHDYEQPDVTYLEWMRRAAEQELDIVAVTDHNTVAGIGAIRKEVEWLTRLEEEGRLTKDETTQLAEWRELGEKVLLLPGFEFTATFGFHILGIFPPDTPTRTLELLLLQLGVPPEKLDEGSTETGATTDVREAYRIIREAGGLVIAAHANSTHGVAMRDFPFGGQTKIAYTQDPNLDALEVTDLAKRGRSTARFFNGTKAEYPRRMHCIQGSDAHCIVKNPKKPKRLGIGERATDLSLTEPTFEAIATLFRGDEFNRTRMARPKDQPYDAVENARDEGPGIALSFHASASARGGKLAAILSDICAFGNTVGGAVFVGADHKKTKPKGLTKPEDTLAEIKEALTERVTPPIDLKYEICETQGQKVLQIVVPKGKDRPYCLDEYKFYVRDEADTHQAVRDEIFALVKSVLDEQNSQSGNSRNGGSNGGGSNGGGSSSNNRRGRRGGRGRGRRSGSDTGANGGERSNSGSNGNNSGEGSDDAFHLPQIGVEVVESVQRNSHQVHSIRDMRNGNVVKNITRKGSRKLWNYAIQSHEDKVVEKAKIEWKGDIGLINVDKRAGKVRYDLALRESGATRVFYGVTEDGMEGRWSAFIQDD